MIEQRMLRVGFRILRIDEIHHVLDVSNEKIPVESNATSGTRSAVTFCMVDDFRSGSDVLEGGPRTAVAGIRHFGDQVNR